MELQTPALDGFISGFTQSVLFLFTTGLGWLCLLAAFGLFVWVRVRKAVAERRLLKQATTGGKLGVGDGVSIFFEETLAIFAKLLANVPVLVGTVVIIAAMVAVSAGVQNINQIVENQKRIDELSAVLRNLDGRYHVADVRSVEYAGDLSTLEVSFYDAAGKAVAGEPQRLSLPGNDIYFDSLVLNFDYSDISKGRSVNLALPYRIFSDRVPQASGTLLKLRDEEGVPLVYKKAAGQVYGIAEDAWTKRLKEFIAIASDDKRARTEGIVRSLYGQAVHKRIAKGESFQVWIEQSGGLTIKGDRGF